MRIDRDNSSTEEIGLSDFCAAVEEKLASGASVWDCRDELVRLSNNKDLLLDEIHRDLENLWGHDYRGHHGNAALLPVFEGSYAANRTYRVRFVFWEEPRYIHQKNKIFLYDDVPHDHNFELLTVGYAGPGYETSIWHHDGSDVVGYVGEKVPLSYQGRFTLAPGTLLWLQQNQDVHIQHGPAAASVSLNLITLVNPQPRQYFFDIARQRISQVVPKLVQRREPLFQIAALLGNEETLELLTGLIARKSLDPALQRAAMAAAGHIYRSHTIIEADE